MKVTATVVLCTLVVLLQNMETPLAQAGAPHLPQYCSAPECSDGAILDSYTCQCVNFTKSVCPIGTNEVVNDDGQCSCQAAEHPECDQGYILNPNLCVCKIKTTPSCPNSTYLIPSNAFCFGVDRPTCPKGFKKVGCKCVKNVDRVCESGEITKDGCKCKNTYTPECSGGCSLNTNGKCACEDRRRIQCYYTTTCSKYSWYVDDVADCCYGYPETYSGDSSGSPPHTIDYVRPYSYRVGDGDCYTCAFYYYYYTHHRG